MNTSKSASDAHGFGSNFGCQNACRSATASGEWVQHASIFARSHPLGKNPSSIEPDRVLSRFIVDSDSSLRHQTAHRHRIPRFQGRLLEMKTHKIALLP